MGMALQFSPDPGKPLANSSIGFNAEWWALILACPPQWLGFPSMDGTNRSSAIYICKERKGSSSLHSKRSLRPAGSASGKVIFGIEKQSDNSLVESSAN